MNVRNSTRSSVPRPSRRRMRLRCSSASSGRAEEGGFGFVSARIGSMTPRVRDDKRANGRCPVAEEGYIRTTRPVRPRRTGVPGPRPRSWPVACSRWARAPFESRVPSVSVWRHRFDSLVPARSRPFSLVSLQELTLFHLCGKRRMVVAQPQSALAAQPALGQARGGGGHHRQAATPSPAAAAGASSSSALTGKPAVVRPWPKPSRYVCASPWRGYRLAIS